MPPELQVPGRRPRLEPPAWETDVPEEIEAWEEESEIPVAWLPDFEPASKVPAPAQSPRQLLERLARSAAAATREGAAPTPSATEVGEIGGDPASTSRLSSSRGEPLRLARVRERLSSPTSLREVFLLKEIMGPPRARRRGPFPS